MVLCVKIVCYLETIVVISDTLLLCFSMWLSLLDDSQSISEVYLLHVNK